MADFRHDFFTCVCGSDEHVLHITLDETPIGDDPPELWVSMFLWEWSWYKRIWIALKYIFGYKCRYGHWDTAAIQPHDAKRFSELAVWYQTLVEEHEKAHPKA